MPPKSGMLWLLCPSVHLFVRPFTSTTTCPILYETFIQMIVTALSNSLFVCQSFRPHVCPPLQILSALYLYNQ